MKAARRWVAVHGPSRRILLAVATLISLVILMLYRQYIPIKPQEHPPEFSLFSMSAEADAEWWPVLAHGRINRIVPWNPYGLSEKFQVVFENGFKAGGKLCEPFSLWEKGFPVHEYHDRPTLEKRNVRRAWGVQQGYGELMAYYVDRALGWYKKPTAAGRYVTNKQLYMEDFRWWAVLLRMMPTYRIPVVLIGWYEGMRVVPPSLDVKKMMTRETTLRQGSRTAEKAAQVADCMVFDYIMDDHDRVEEHNWLVDANGKYVFWDSGLSFRYGPMGSRERDMEILCGRRGWKDGVTFNRKCSKTRVFRRSTIEMLQRLGRSDAPLSVKVKETMKSDPLFPIVNFAAFYVDRIKYPRVKYRAENFLQGFDKRVKELVQYVEELLKNYPAEEVLIDDQGQ